MNEAYVPSDAIEGGVFEVEEDGLQLILTGDFVETVKKYLEDDSITSIRVNIGMQEATEMCESFYEIKHG